MSDAFILHILPWEQRIAITLHFYLALLDLNVKDDTLYFLYAVLAPIRNSRI